METYTGSQISKIRLEISENRDPMLLTLAEMLANRAAKVTDDTAQLTITAFSSEESLILVLRTRKSLAKARAVHPGCTIEEVPIHRVYLKPNGGIIVGS